MDSKLQLPKGQAARRESRQTSERSSLFFVSYRGPTDTEIKQSIKAWILEYLERTDKSQAKLAEELGVTEATISNIVLGEFLPGFRVLVRLHFALGVELREVMRHESKKARPVAHKTRGEM